MNVISVDDINEHIKAKKILLAFFAAAIIIFGLYGGFFPKWYEHKLPEMERYLRDTGYENIKPIGYGSIVSPGYEFEVTNRDGDKDTVYVSIVKGNYTIRYGRYW